MATGISKMLLSEGFSSFNDNQNYLTNYALLAHLQKRRRTETKNTYEVKIDERPYYFVIRLQKSAFRCHRTLTDAQKNELWRNNPSFQNALYWGSSRVTWTACKINATFAEKIGVFGIFAVIGYESLPGGVDWTPHHFEVHRILKRNHNIEDRLD